MAVSRPFLLLFLILCLFSLSLLFSVSFSFYSLLFYFAICFLIHHFRFDIVCLFHSIGCRAFWLKTGQLLGSLRGQFLLVENGFLYLIYELTMIVLYHVSYTMGKNSWHHIGRAISRKIFFSSGPLVLASTFLFKSPFIVQSDKSVFFRL